jgi:hypothetical protein
MSGLDAFIVNGRMPDIEYTTNAPEEVVCPRVTTREGVPVVYMHNKRGEADKGFVPVAEFLERLARREPDLVVTGYRANGRQTTISFNKHDRVSLSARLQAHLSAITAPRNGRSAAIVAFLGNLTPLYVHERFGAAPCARSLQDGTLILPVDESEWDEKRGEVLMHWQGDPSRSSNSRGDDIAALAIERYVRFHGAGASEESIAAELWFMARHYSFKTGGDAYLPQLQEPPHRLVWAGKTAARMGEGVLVNLISRLVGAS